METIKGPDKKYDEVLISLGSNVRVLCYVYVAILSSAYT